MAEPNADDGLMPEIVRVGNDAWLKGALLTLGFRGLKADLFKHDRELFNRKAAEMTAQHAQTAQGHAPNAAPARKMSSSDSTIADEEQQNATQDTVVAEVPSQSKEDALSDDSFSDGSSSSEGEADDWVDDEVEDKASGGTEDAAPPNKRRRQE
jgi:hypothetical protein